MQNTGGHRNRLLLQLAPHSVWEYGAACFPLSHHDCYFAITRTYLVHIKCSQSGCTNGVLEVSRSHCKTFLVNLRSPFKR